MLARGESSGGRVVDARIRHATCSDDYWSTVRRSFVGRAFCGRKRKWLVMKSEVVSLSEWRKTRSEPCPIRVKRNMGKRPHRPANLLKSNVVKAVNGTPSMPLGTRTTLFVVLLVLAAGLWFWMVLRLDAVVVVKVAKLWHLDIP